jgi:uncharacterized protein YcbK (DUF882 family)
MPYISRRRFCIAAAQAAAGLLVSPSLNCLAGETKKIPLAFFHTHTGECLEIMHTPGLCTGDVQRRIAFFLRDFRTEDVYPIDPGLLDILCRVQALTGSRGTIEIISGYRSAATNAMLRGASGGVASHSLHMEGRAVDVRITDLPSRTLSSAAVALRTGGVGYYAASDFVHLDTGRVRTW